MFFKYSLFEKYHLCTFTTTRHGGVSRNNYSSFNLSLFSDDNEVDVLRNREILTGELGVSSDLFFVPFQTHEDKIKIIEASFLSLPASDQLEQLHGYDALITNVKNICIGITTADCVPLLIYDPIKHVLAVIHAGWKGTALRIAAKTVLQMMNEFDCKASDLLVAIGPSISPLMFEVGDEVGDAFVSERFDLEIISFRNKETGKLHIDLWKANIYPLLDLGIENKNIEVAEVCTYQDENFFSARRQTILSGRMVTGGVLK